VTVVGVLPQIEPGETLSVSGDWEHHPRFGDQLRVISWEVKLPATTEGILSYLKNGAIKGIGPTMADRIVRHFGKNTLEAIESYPQRLQEVDGIGPSKAAQIVESWSLRNNLRQLMRFLQESGVNPAHGAGIYRLYGKDAVMILKTDPYRIARDLPGIGFVVADCVSRHLGTAEDDPMRVKACICHMLERNSQEGHTFIAETQLYQSLKKLFGLPWHTVHEALSELVYEGTAVIETNDWKTDGSQSLAVYLTQMHRGEVEIAHRLCAMMAIARTDTDLDTAGLSEAIARKLAIQLSDEQFEVLTGALSKPVAIITGGPGTGKTTLIRSLKTVFGALGKKVLLCAPTGRAARRLSEITGDTAVTIHRLLGYGFQAPEDGPPNFFRDRDNPLQADAVIVDEASMIDTLLMQGLLNAIAPSCRLILVGDGFQLPSVGPGNVLSDLIDSDRIPVFFLNRIFRQADQSPIVINAHRIRTGNMPDAAASQEPKPDQEFCFIEETEPRAVVSRIGYLCTQHLPRKFNLHPSTDIQVITPMHRGTAGTINLNHTLQKTLNPDSEVIETLGGSFRVADKVMHLKNNYQKEVFNGDIGVIRSVDKGENRLSVDYFGRIVDYDFAETVELSLAYAISVHKSQGSEYPAVIVPLVTEHYPMLQRNLLYTAITRGIRLVVFIGSRKALSIALHNDRPGKRLTSLSSRFKTLD
jgi:exodeoxyribonuclease V alpha subunit